MLKDAEESEELLYSGQTFKSPSLKGKVNTLYSWGFLSEFVLSVSK